MSQRNAEPAWKGHVWYEPARAWGVAHQFFPVVFNSEEYISWLEYFHRLGWYPAAFKECRKNHPWPAPDQWPTEFEATVKFRQSKNGPEPRFKPPSWYAK